MFVLALVHTFPFLVYDIKSHIMVKQWKTQITYWTGVAALIFQAYLTFISLPFFRYTYILNCLLSFIEIHDESDFFVLTRKRFYEFFKSTHMLAALAFCLFFFFHCDFTLTSVYVQGSFFSSSSFSSRAKYEAQNFVYAQSANLENKHYIATTSLQQAAFTFSV